MPKINETTFAQIILYDIIPNYKIETSFNKDLIAKAEDEDEKTSTEVLGLYDISYEEDTNTEINTDESFSSDIDINKLNDLDYLKQKFYTVDSKTGLSSDYFNVNDFLNTSVKVDKDGDEPKVLIFHTHSQEMFIDSDKNDIYEGIVGAGARLAQTLEEVYGIKTIHYVDTFDVVDGKNQITGAYERMEPVIRKILEENPSIELVIDLHRDGVSEDTHLVETINGKPTAKIMFFNGISRINEDGELKDIDYLENPYIKQNLALSFKMQKRAMEKYEGFTRKIYINAYRYSLHMKPLSMLIEAGAQTNTKEEIYNAMDLLADLINDVVFS